MRSVCDGTGRESMVKTDAVFREGVEGGRLDIGVAVAVDVIGTDCVDGNEVDFRSILVVSCLRHRSRTQAARDANQSPQESHGGPQTSIDTAFSCDFARRAIV
jgi:hypothetical protein